MVELNSLVLTDDEYAESARLLSPPRKHVEWLNVHGFKFTSRFYIKEYLLANETEIRITLEYISATNYEEIENAGKWKSIIKRKKSGSKRSFSDCDTIGVYAENPRDSLKGIFEVNNQVNQSMMDIAKTF